MDQQYFFVVSIKIDTGPIQNDTIDDMERHSIWTVLLAYVQRDRHDKNPCHLSFSNDFTEFGDKNTYN